MNIRSIFCLILFVFMSFAASAQTYIQYTYDLNGNRQTRQLTVMQLKSTKISFPITNVRVLEEEMDKISDINEEQIVRIYPNPAGEFLNILFSGSIPDEPSEARLYDLNGNLLKYKKSQDSQMEIDVATLKDGVYVLIIKRGTYISNHKIIRGRGY